MGTVLAFISEELDVHSVCIQISAQILPTVRPQTNMPDDVMTYSFEYLTNYTFSYGLQHGYFLFMPSMVDYWRQYALQTRSVPPLTRQHVAPGERGVHVCPKHRSGTETKLS